MARGLLSCVLSIGSDSARHDVGLRAHPPPRAQVLRALLADRALSCRLIEEAARGAVSSASCCTSASAKCVQTGIISRCCAVLNGRAGSYKEHQFIEQIKSCLRMCLECSHLYTHVLRCQDGGHRLLISLLKAS